MKSRSTEPKTAEQTYLYALRLLTARDYTSVRILAKLIAWCDDREVADAVLQRVQAEGLVNDRRYAERFAGSALQSGRYVGSRLRMELRRRGITAELVDVAMSAAGEEFDEEAELSSLVERRYPDFVYAETDDRIRRRVFSFLQRRGYSPGLIMKVLRRTKEY